MKTVLSFLCAVSLFADELAPPAPMSNSTEDPATVEAPAPVAEPATSDTYGSFILNEFKMGYFRSGSKSIRHIYDDGLLDLQLSSSFCVWKPLYIYFAVEYIGAKGRLLGGHEKTSMRIVPLSLGLQYIQPITYDFKYYLTLGPRYFFFHQHNKSSSVPHTVNNSGLGGFINTGFLYYLTHHITVGFFGEYSYKRMSIGGTSLQVGGLTIGGEIGYFW